jgi:hypothetical protein
LCRTSNGWRKSKLEASEVISRYDISDTVAFDLTQEHHSKVSGVRHLMPVKILLSAALAVIKEVPGGADTGSKSQGEARGGAGAGGETV